MLTRRLHVTLHWSIVLLILSMVKGGSAATSLPILMVLGAAHGLFHLWRHTALYDNALRPITPRFLHHVL